MIDRNQYPEDEQITTKQAATAIGYNRRTIVTWIREGLLPATRRPGKRGHYRVIWRDVYDLINRPAVPSKE